MSITGERVTTAAGGWGPTWQRHVAAYKLCAPLLGPGRVLDLGCGTGHSYHLLSPRETVGVDIDPTALAGQERETHVADMTQLPFADGSFASVLAVQSLEHVTDPDRALAEAARVLGREGAVAVFVTPNRLTFARPDEIIDPYHHFEWDPEQLRRLCAGSFESVEELGVHGSARYLELVAAERRRLDALLRLDRLRLRRLVPRGARKRLYDVMLTRARRAPNPLASAITTEDFELRGESLHASLDLVAVCRLPRRR
jgi:SAM-dependent methyltransferase